MKGLIGLLVVVMMIGGLVDRAIGDRPSHLAVAKSLAKSLAENASDADATGLYLALVDTALTAIEANHKSIETSVYRVADDVARECPAVATGAAADQSRWPVEVGITEDLGIAADHANTAILHQLLRRSERLRLRDVTLAGLVQRGVRAAARQAGLARPPICMVLREWRQDHFRQTPRKLADFSRRFETVSEAADLAPSALGRYVDRRDLATLHDVQHRKLVIEYEMGTRILIGRMHIFQVIGLRRLGVWRGVRT